MADIAELQKPEWAASGIQQSPIDNNATRGHALIFGPKDSPQEDCPMLQSVELPTTYPFDPPKVIFLTGDGRTRFHPNMYVEGKVCLSILGTWSGPGWASTMKISTVLVTLQSLMDNEPIRHEPAYATKNEPQYTLAVEQACIRQILWARELATKGNLQNIAGWENFTDIFEEKWPQIAGRLRIRLTALTAKEPTLLHLLPYSMGNTVLNWSILRDQLQKLEPVSGS